MVYGKNTHQWEKRKKRPVGPITWKATTLVTMAVLITLPHGSTPTGDGTHNSDTGALNFLPILEEALEELDIPFVSMVGTTNRDILDLNRLRAFSHPWVQQARKEMLKAEVHICLHSYPMFTEPTRSSTGYDLEVCGQHTVVLFNTPEITDQDFLQDIERELERNGDKNLEEQGGLKTTLAIWQVYYLTFRLY